MGWRPLCVAARRVLAAPPTQRKARSRWAIPEPPPPTCHLYGQRRSSPACPGGEPKRCRPRGQRRWPDPVGVDEPTTPVPTWPTPSRPAPLWRSSSRSLVVTGAVSDAAAAAGPTQVAWSVHGAVNVTIWSIDSDGAGFQAILSAAIGDYGPAVTVFPDGKVDARTTRADGARASARDVPPIHRRDREEVPGSNCPRAG